MSVINSSIEDLRIRRENSHKLKMLSLPFPFVSGTSKTHYSLYITEPTPNKEFNNHRSKYLISLRLSFAYSKALHLVSMGGSFASGRRSNHHLGSSFTNARYKSETRGEIRPEKKLVSPSHRSWKLISLGTMAWLPVSVGLRILSLEKISKKYDISCIKKLIVKKIKIVKNNIILFITLKKNTPHITESNGVLI